MTDTVTAPVEAGSEQIPVVTEVTAPEGAKFSNASDAAKALRSYRKPKEAVAAPVEEVPAETEIPPEGENAEQPEETPVVAGETQEVEAETRLDPPRSWSREAHEDWSTIPPAAQARILERAKQDDAAVQKAQREAAEVKRSNETERQQLEQARQQYEAIAQQQYQMLASSGEFADIQSPADEMRLAKEDVLRHAQYQAHKSALQESQRATYEAQARQQQQFQQELQTWGNEQDKLAMDAIPEAKDQVKWKSLRESSVNYLKDVGFSDSELTQLWNGGSALRDHRVQRIIADAAKAKSAQAKLETSKAKPLPPVQRPGVAQPKGAALAAQVQTLDQKLTKTGSVKDAVALLKARRAAQ